MRKSSSYGKLISYCKEYLCTTYGILLLDENEPVASYQGGVGWWGRGVIEIPLWFCLVNLFILTQDVPTPNVRS